MFISFFRLVVKVQSCTLFPDWCEAGTESEVFKARQLQQSEGIRGRL